MEIQQENRLIFSWSILSGSVQNYSFDATSQIFYLFIYLFLALLGLRCCVWAFSSWGKQGLLFVAVHGLLIVVDSLVVEHRP